MRFVRLFCAVCVCACGSGGTAQDAGTDAASSGDGASDAGADVAVANAECVEAGTACQACCTTLHPDASTIFDDAIVGCACGNNAPCNNACSANFCASLTSTKQCDTCISAKCYPNAKTACTADPSCGAWLACLVPCP